MAGTKGDAPIPEIRLADAPGHLLRRCQQRAVDLYARRVGRDGLTPRQFALLIAILQEEGLSQADLVRRSGIDRSTVADMLRRMVGRGLLARDRTEGDGRANAVRLTTAGRAALARAVPLVELAQVDILAPLPADRRAGFLADLRLVCGLAAADDGAAAR